MQRLNFYRFRLVFSIALIAGISGSQQVIVADDDISEASLNQASVTAKAVLAAMKGESEKSSKFKKFDSVTKDAKKHEGLFNLYQKDNHLYAVIKPSQLDKSFLAPMAIAEGMASAGIPLNFGDEWVLQFHRAGDKIQVIRKNIHYEAPAGSPLKKAVEQNYLDSILMAIPIVSDDPPGGGVLVDLTDIFFSDFADISLGSLDRNRTTWHQVKTFKNNIELQVKATFRGGYFMSYFGSDDGVIDSRGITVVIHYSLTKLPGSGYKPRFADQRVGYFINATKDFGSDNPNTNFKRRINRWRLEKSNPSAKLSPPKKQVVWWVENNVPHEYRPYVEEGILEWNKAFEKIGFRNALGVRWQQEGDEFDPEDINYCTFRWVTTPYTFAMSGLRADPITGEMIDGDVVFDASWIRYWKQEYSLLVGTPVSTEGDSGPNTVLGAPYDVGEVISPIMAAKHGYGLPAPSPAHSMHARMRQLCQCDQCGHSGGTPPQVVPSSWSPLQVMLNRRLNAGRFSSCQYGLAKRQEFRLAALAMAAKASDDDEEKDDEEKKAELPEEFLGQLIKEIVMHEVGHSLGLRHNFKASSMLSLDEVNDTSITREKGMTGSVMDYNPVNISPDQDNQGDYATTTIGPYDYWAIEYAYKPIDGNEEEELKKIAARSPEPDLTYATDEDMYLSNDPNVNAYDLGDDSLAYGKQRIELAENLLPKIVETAVEDGDSWARLRTAFSVLLGQYGNAAYLATGNIGGQHFSKHHKGDKDVDDPIIPVAGKKQRESLEFLTDKILSDDAFEFEPELLRKLTIESWYHWGSSLRFFGNVDYPVYDRILSIQRIPLNHCLSAGVLHRIQNHQLMAADDEPLEIDEVFQTLTDSIWAELDPEADELEISLIRRNLQREHLKKLSSIVVGQRRNSLYDLYSFVLFSGSSYSYPADAKSLARMHLKDLGKRIEAVMEKEEAKVDNTTRAHLEEVASQIEKTLDAEMSANGV